MCTEVYVQAAGAGPHTGHTAQVPDVPASLGTSVSV